MKPIAALLLILVLSSCTKDCGKDEQGRQLVPGKYGTCVPENRKDI